MIQYEYYVMHGDKILSGWTCKEDAQEQAKETRENGVTCKVSARITLEKRGIATRQKKNWFNEHEIVRNPVIKSSNKLDKFRSDLHEAIHSVTDKHYWEDPDDVDDAIGMAVERICHTVTHQFLLTLKTV